MKEEKGTDMVFNKVNPNKNEPKGGHHNEEKMDCSDYDCSNGYDNTCRMRKQYRYSNRN